MNKTQRIASHVEVVINFEAVASFKDRFDAAAFVRANGGFIRLVTKTIQRPLAWWIDAGEGAVLPQHAAFSRGA